MCTSGKISYGLLGSLCVGLILLACQVSGRIGYDDYAEKSVLQLRNQSTHYLREMLELMMMAAAFDAQWYDVTTNVSDECHTLTRHLVSTLESHPTNVDQRMLDAIRTSINETVDVIKVGTQQPNRHPAETLCDKMKRKFKQDSKLMAAYDRIVNDTKTNPQLMSVGELCRHFGKLSRTNFKLEFVLMQIAVSDGDDFHRATKKIDSECKSIAKEFLRAETSFGRSLDVGRVHELVHQIRVNISKNNTECDTHPLHMFCDGVVKNSEFRWLSESANKTNAASNHTRPKSRPTIHRMYTKLFDDDYGHLFAFNSPTFARIFIFNVLTNRQYVSTVNGTYKILLPAILSVGRSGQFTDKVDEIQDRIAMDVYDRSFTVITDGASFLPDKRLNSLRYFALDEFERRFNEDADLRRALETSKKAIEVKELHARKPW